MIVLYVMWKISLKVTIPLRIIIQLCSSLQLSQSFTACNFAVVAHCHSATSFPKADSCVTGKKKAQLNLMCTTCPAVNDRQMELQKS